MPIKQAPRAKAGRPAGAVLTHCANGHPRTPEYGRRTNYREWVCWACGRQQDPAPIIYPSDVARAIVAHVCRERNLLEADILRSDDRSVPLVQGRKLVAYLLHTVASMTHVEIGALMSRNHATVAHLLGVLGDDVDLWGQAQAMERTLREDGIVLRILLQGHPQGPALQAYADIFLAGRHADFQMRQRALVGLHLLARYPGLRTPFRRAFPARHGGVSPQITRMRYHADAAGYRWIG